MRAHIEKKDPLASVIEIVTEIIEHPDTTKAYEDKMGEIQGASQCVVKVDSVELRNGYKKLSLMTDKETVSYKTDAVAISYRTLTHKLVGKAVSFGLCCSHKGKMELYRFIEGETDCVKLAELELSDNIVDPIYALVSEDKLYIVYNVPSPKALKSSTRMRIPVIEEDGVLASGAPGIVCFDLKGKSQERLLVPFEPMNRYSCGLYYDERESEPKLAVANIYDTASPEEHPSFRALIESFLDVDEEAAAVFPFGVSSISFIGETEIHQAPMDGDPGNGIRSVILKNSDEDDVSIFSLEDAS